jgi:hypothetical protein
MNTKIFAAIIVLALASMACGFDIDLPERVEPGPDVEESITVPVSGSDGETRLTISFGAGTLKLSPGAKELVEGTVVYNFPEFKPEIINNDGKVEIKHKDFRNLINPNDINNKWDLQLGNTPIDLTINAGAYEGRYEFGGLSLTNVSVQDGAGEGELCFSERKG